MLIFTICARNYLAYALSLRESVRQHEPEADFLIFLSDEAVEDEAVRDFTVPITQLGLPALESLRARYTILELSTAIKPFCFAYAFDQLGHQEAVYLDPDILLFGPLGAVRAAFLAGASSALTPHLLCPIAKDGKRPSNQDILLSGAFNLGFAAFANETEARAFLSWWGEALLAHCYVLPEEGLFVDQRFVDLAPGFLARLTIIRHPGYNVAYWNLADRPIRNVSGQWIAGEVPLVFFHFSGVVPGDEAVLSKHQDRFTPASIGVDAAALLSGYRARLMDNGHQQWSRIADPYARFRDGTPIPGVVRRALRGRAVPASWFDALDTAYWDAPSEHIDAEPGFTITRLMKAIHESRPDLRAAFALPTRAGRRDFHAWFLTYGGRELRLGEGQIKAALAGARLAHPSLARWLARLRLALTGRARR